MATGFDWTTAAITAASYIYGIHKWNDVETVEICGRSCNVQIKGRIHKLTWVWDGRCEGGGIVGSARHNDDRNGAIQNAIKDYVIKAGQIGLITPEQIQKYTR